MVPEPSPSWLVLLGSAIFLSVRRKQPKRSLG
ncbi:MAG: PEP-CTERM sorting domain-containing protein [Verrucomicrobiota bacterium]|nr:PEP-CTERM sorting domain-containing protein [Verrucomicrobiota bacterium]